MTFANKTLELDIVLKEISNFSYTKTIKDKIINLKPLFTISEIRERQNKIKEAILIKSRSGNLPFLKDFDIIDVLDLIKTKRDLTVSDLQYLRLFLKMTEDIKERSLKFPKEQVTINYLLPYFENLNKLSNILDIIDSTIAPDGSVLDNASEDLSKIRKEINKTKRRRDNVLADLLVKKAKILNDNILIMRNDRYCLPVKTDFKNQIKGVIQDVSASGTTTFIEPAEASELSNIIVKLNHDEKTEILKILRSISIDIQPYYDDLLMNMEILLALDFYFSAALYSLKYDCHMPNINELGNVNLIAARHPLIPQDEVVPINIKVNEIKPVLMITGPNTGGKTVAIKTLGLLSIMAQTGLLIPASKESDVAIFSGVYADIGDHQSIKQSLSTFSSHIKNVNEIINNAQEMSLILLDELGSGTDPNEGTSLAMSIVDYFLKKNVRLVLTTHYSELKIYAYESPLIENASVKFDNKTLKPLYEIEYGKSGSSNALLIAERLGLNKEIIEQAKIYLTDKETDLSESILRFEEKIELLDERINKIKKTEVNILKKEEELQNKILELELEKEKVFLNTEKEVKKQLKKITDEAEKIFKKLEDNPKEHEIASLKHDLTKLGIERKEKPISKTLNVGDSVFIKAYKQSGKIIAKKGKKYTVKFGIFELDFADVDLIKTEKQSLKPQEQTKRKSRTHHQTPAIEASVELDLRGYRYEDVEDAYKKFIDQALLANLKELRIIHGFGTGAVRKALYEQLKKDKNIKKYRFGGETEGMGGVTIVTIA